MADYSSQKVPELKKLLQDRGLAMSGNKADLIARLQENDKKNGSKSYLHVRSTVLSYIY
jgi:SAP domain-containing ribonucleoprotein